MAQLSENGREFFKACGAKGGKSRAKRLSAAHRVAIATEAARARWHRHSPSTTPIFESVRLNRAQLNNPVYLSELLSEGSLNEWRALYREIANYPFGESASALERVLSSTAEYGITPLWRAILQTVRGGGLP